MKYKFNLQIAASLPLEEGFSLDELVIETKRMFDADWISGLVNLVATLLDWIVHQSLLGSWEKSDPGRCCAHAHYVIHGREAKSIRSSVGRLAFLWTRIRCQGCGKSFVPLRGYLNMERHQRKTSELVKMVAEVVSEQSYRRSSQHLSTKGSIPVPHTTLHRWVMASDCDKIDMKKRVQTLVADGTGYKQKPDGDGSNRGDCALSSASPKMEPSFPTAHGLKSRGPRSVERSERRIIRVRKSSSRRSQTYLYPTAKCRC